MFFNYSKDDHLTKWTLFFFLGEMGGFEDGVVNSNVFFRGDVEELFSIAPIFNTLCIGYLCIVC